MKYIKSNIGFIVAIILLAAVIFIPEVKASLLRGLMKTGLFSPDIEITTGSIEEKSLPKAPDVQLISATGEILNLNNTNGKVVFLNFWATWCPPCVAEMPSIQALKNKLKHPDGVIFAMVDADNNLDKSVAFMQKNKYDLPVYGQASAIPESLFKGNLPTTIILNKNGEIVLNHEGMADYNTAEMENLLNSLTSTN
jgi:thiol-disulfide isomerase/thioredoxin